jgi:hypothetical protein
MNADTILASVANILRETGDDGIDGEGVRLILRQIGAAKVVPDDKAKSVALTDSGWELQRAECIEPTCPWVNTDQCRYGHPKAVRTYALVDKGQS